ncbi:MAG: GNAT family N-acetyltransferase [Deltaproteobacteria bacterium]|nr:GNAT family N-acetyltransferase [Deltaproteobacteria bacterium]
MPEQDHEPPKRIRVTGLQEAQLPALVRIEQVCAAMYAEAGVEIAPRDDAAIARLRLDHDVHVAEADHEVAGYVAWADRAPGVAELDLLLVSPRYQRFGLGTRLLREMADKARGFGLAVAVVRCWRKATWAHAFLLAQGFAPADGTLPDKVQGWLDEQQAGGSPLESGQIALWRKIEGLGVRQLPGVPLPPP